jgi:hypothetical protein
MTSALITIKKNKNESEQEHHHACQKVRFSLSVCGGTNWMALRRSSTLVSSLWNCKEIELVSDNLHQRMSWRKAERLSRLCRV